MRFPLDRIYEFSQWYPLNTKTMYLGFGFNLEYPKWIQDLFNVKVHDGWDWGVPEGEPIYAVANGEIRDVQDTLEWGKGIWQDIDEGRSVAYWHNSINYVVVGQYVQEGTIIGLTGKTGKASGPHLHFGLIENGAFKNPLSLFLDNMKYIMNVKGDQYLIFDNPKIAIGIADVAELAELQKVGLSGNPSGGEVPDGYLVYPGIRTSRLTDLFNL